MSATPTPRRLYVHDDLTEAAWTASHRRHAIVRLVTDLFTCARREPHAAVLTLPEQVDAVLARGAYPPFATTIGIGPAGERVARQLHARAGWFPSIVRVDVLRVETIGGEYALTGPAPLRAQLAGITAPGPLAIVDDTLFSGLTLRAVVSALPYEARHRARIFCLRGVAESVPAVARLCPVTIGFAAPGRILTDVSFINAGGLVRRGAIRRAGASPLAFFERPEWMQAWFPACAAEVVGVCRRLHALLDGPAGASFGAARAV